MTYVCLLKFVYNLFLLFSMHNATYDQHHDNRAFASAKTKVKEHKA